jgi:DNA gyrase subunit A
MKLRDKDEVAALCLINAEDELLFVSSKGTMTRQAAEGISVQGRYAKGTRLQRIDEGEYLVNVARVVKPVEKGEE